MTNYSVGSVFQGERNLSSEYRKGFLLTLAGILIWTPDTLLIRLADVEFFTLAFIRGALGGALMVVGFSLHSGRRFLHHLFAIGSWGALIVVLQASTNWTYYAALERTTVANVLVFFASTPLITALMTRAFLQDDIKRPTWIAIWSAGLGLLIVASGGLSTGNWLGDLIALTNAVIIAVVLTVVRHRRDVNMIPAAGLGLLLAALLAAPFAAFPDISSMRWLFLILGAGLVLPAALALSTLGPRYLPTPEVALLALLETILGPLWVWIVIGEQPGIRTFIGGSIVVGALFFHALWRFRQLH